MATSPGISVKLSALHPRYEWTHRGEVMDVLLPRARDLARAAARAGIGFNVDAEEAERLDLSLDVIEALMADRLLAGWDGFGVVVQAYGRRAGAVIDWLDALAARHDRRIMVRLVKGAYWDAEIKQAQERGLPGFPVFTRKPSTDVELPRQCAASSSTPATGSIRSSRPTTPIPWRRVLEMAGDGGGFEFQRLHGMGEALHEIVRERAGTRCRIYAPVGAHRDLLAYLVRRLLENGANSSFVNQIVDKRLGAGGDRRRSARGGRGVRRRDRQPRRSAGRRRSSRRGRTRAAGTSTSRPRSQALLAARAGWRSAPLAGGADAGGRGERRRRGRSSTRRTPATSSAPCARRRRPR